MDDAKNIQPFWMVYGIGQARPIHRHKTEAGAVEEASRLARNNPGVTFCVLSATHAVVKRDVEIQRIDPDFAEVEPLPPKPWSMSQTKSDRDIPF